MRQKQEGKLRKEIGVFGGVSLVAGMTIGSGIYYLGSYVLERTNMTQGAALLCWTSAVSSPSWAACALPSWALKCRCRAV